MLSVDGEWLHDAPVSLALSSSPASLSFGQLKEKVNLLFNVPCGWELAVVLSGLEHLKENCISTEQVVNFAAFSP